MDPKLAGNLALKSNVGQLILTHFGASLYRIIEDRKWAEEEARKIFPSSTAAKDGMEFTL